LFQVLKVIWTIKQTKIFLNEECNTDYVGLFLNLRETLILAINIYGNLLVESF
jgi:hypothetical protein